MRIVLALAACLAVPAAATAQPPADWFTKPLLPETMRQSQMYAFVNANIPPLPQFLTLDEWTKYRGELKSQLLRLIGIDDILEKHVLKAQSRGRLERDGYTIEKIDYESYPGMHVSAIVWVPAGLKGKAPAAICISGHTYCDSKAADYVQARAYNLVRRGFIVVSYDYFGCSERARIDPCKPGVYGGEDHMNALYSYTRRTPTGIEVLDGIRAVDYLYSRPDVDRTRIAFTGESGGGNSTYWVSALDDRVTLSMPVSAAGSMSQWIKGDYNYDWHQRPPGIRAIADIGSLYALVAPRPLQVVNGHAELLEFALPDAHRSVAYARAVYALYNKTDAITFAVSTTDHGYQPDKRVLLYRWLNRWFFDGKMPYGEEDLPYRAEPKETLRVGLPADNLTIPTLARRWVDEGLATVIAPLSSADAAAWQREQRERLEDLLARRNPFEVPEVIYNYNYLASAAPYRLERLPFEVAPDVVAPAVLVRREQAGKAKVIVCMGKAFGASAEARALLDKGYALFCLDPRGTGEVAWGGSRTSNWANFVGRPPVGMWSEDVSKATSYLLSRPDVDRVAVLGFGVLGKAALYAAALDERIAAAAVALDTVSYRDEATSGLVHVFADVPHILTWGDTAQLAALVAPRPLAILSAGLPVSYNNERPSYFTPAPRFDDPGEGAPEESLRENFAWTQELYRTMGAAKSLDLGTRGAKRGEALVAWFLAHF